MTTPRIYLVLQRPDGHDSVAEIEGGKITSAMIDSAEDLFHTLTTGERPIIRNLYELGARAFGISREEVKDRLAAAAYGMPKATFDKKLERKRLP